MTFERRWGKGNRNIAKKTFKKKHCKENIAKESIEKKAPKRSSLHSPISTSGSVPLVLKSGLEYKNLWSQKLAWQDVAKVLIF